MRIILYANRNVGLCAMSYLVAKGHEVRVITEDVLLGEMSRYYGLDVVTLDTMGTFDLFICCHGRKIIPEKYLIPGKFVNIHPCLFKYKGHNPIRRYITNRDTRGSVESQYMIEEVDAGEVIHSEFFETPVVTTYAEFYNIALPFYFRCLEETLNKLNARGGG